MKVEKWYDRHTRSWVIQLLDDNGNEIECSYAGNKDEAEYIEKEMQKEVKESNSGKDYVLSEIIKDFRKRTKMSQAVFADYFGIPVRSLQEWEQGRKCPPVYVVQLMKRIWNLEH